MKIAIIGGGFTGLTAAYELTKKGHQVTILERNQDFGGLAGGFQIQGSNLEKTYHHIFKTDTDIINFVKEIGIEDKLEWNPSLVSIYYNGRIYKFGTPISLLLFKPLNIINRFRVGFVMLFLQKFKNWHKFVQIPAFEWIKKASGKQATQVIWEPLLKGKFHEHYDKISMAWLWARLHIRANSQERGGEKLGYFRGGFNVITQRLLELLQDGRAELKTGIIVKSIKSTDSSTVLIEYDNQAEQFDKVIATVPSNIFAELIKDDKNISPDYLNKLRSIQYLGAVCLIFSSDQDISDYYWHNINDISFPFLVFINHTKMVGKERYNGKNIYYIGAYIPNDNRYFSISDDELSGQWFDSLQKIFPEFDKNQIGDLNIFRLKNAQHIVTLDYQSKIPEYNTPITNVFLSNFSQIFPEDRGTNYAVREGKRIAELISSK